MKRIYNRLLSLAFGAVVAGGVMTACSDDLGFDENFVEGEPVTLSIDCAVGEMPVVSRADMAAGRDKEINSVWIGFYGADGSLKHHFTYGEGGDIKIMDEDFQTLENMKITSGRYHIVAVANYEGNMGVTPTQTTPKDLKTLLDEAKTFDQYKAIAVYTDPGSVDTPTGNLVMQGVYVESRKHDKDVSSDFWAIENESLTAVSSGTTKLPGAIHFRRLISQVKFNITFDNTNIESFEPVSMTVYNVPTVSWLAERADGDAGNTVTNAGDNINLGGKEYTSSRRFYSFEGTTTRTIDWYQMENRRQAVIDVPTYAERERERKNDITDSEFKENSGIYTALCGESGDTYMKNNNATYVVFHARLKMKKLPLQENPQDPQVVQRTVDAVYTVHLGYCEPKNGAEAEKSKDFNCRRNYKYTYNMKIIGVDKIEVEAKKEDQDYEHGAEGLITDITGAFFPADSHFEQRNVQLSASELTDLKWSMRIYTDQRNFLTIDQDNYTNFDAKYWDWIGFIPTSSATQCATYNPANVIKLSELKDKGTGGWYTMFIDEYIYEDATTEPGVTHGNLTPNWKSYVNLPDRTMWLKVEEARSQDQESVIVKSKYAVQQKSLQTYYGINPENPASSMALEHVDEYDGNEIPESTNPITQDITNRGGRYLMASHLKILDNNSVAWNSKLNLGVLQLNGDKIEQGIPQMSTSELRSLCLNRNRDLNGNSIIDPEELRWFLPGIHQYVRFVMGSHSLQTPLYTYEGRTQSDTPSHYHYGSAEGWTLWAEEYISTGQWGGEIKHIRCARYLGVNMNEFSETPAQPAFKKRDGENIVDFHYGKESSRNLSAGSLPIHYVNSEYNRVAKAIEYATDDYPIKYPWSSLTVDSWITTINDADPCEKSKGQGWRVPNQTEMTALMFILGEWTDIKDEYGNPKNELGNPNNTFYLTSTLDFYGQHIMGVTAHHATRIKNELNASYTYINVKCVKDIE